MRAAVIGAGGAIGAALVDRLVADGRFDSIHALARRELPPRAKPVVAATVDIEDPASVTAAASAVGAPLDLLLIATGLLHDDAHRPERALRDLDAAWLARNFAVNTIGPALVLRAFAPLLPRTRRSVLAALSARVGSISDNRTGGWYGYRASKAALNMMIRCTAIELGRTHPEALCVGLHPGTVDSELSRPFQSHVPAGKLFAPAHAAERLLAVLDGLTPQQSGRCFAWDGTEVLP